MNQIDPSISFESLRAFLLCQKVSLAQLARKHGFKPGNFQQAARQYWGTDREPQGIKTDKMLRALREEVSKLINGQEAA